jgi:hypothetical protein
MPFDFSPYLVGPGEKPASSSKFNNFLTAVQAGMNAMPPANLVGFPSDASKFLNGAGGWSTPVTDMAAVYTKVTPFEIVNNATLLDLLQGQISIAAGKLGPNAAIKIFAGGEYFNNNSNTIRLRIVLGLGSQTVWDSGQSDTINQNGTPSDRRAWHFHAVIQALGSTAQQSGSGLFVMNTPSAAAAGYGKLNSAIGLIGAFENANTTVNMTGSQPLTLQAQHSNAQTTISITLRYCRVEVTA